MDSSIHDLSRVLIELGLVVIGLAILARIASRWGFSAIPLYLLAIVVDACGQAWP